nr:S8 family serine peptidase [Candidatus Sigynarchaeota archaeon]
MAKYLASHDNGTDGAIHVEATTFRRVHELSILPVLVLEFSADIMDTSKIDSMFAPESSILCVEPDTTLYLSTNAASTILDVDSINNSIYGPFHGESIKIAIVDSGIDITHPDLERCIVDKHVFLLKDGISAEIPSSDTGHGTAIAGIIRGSGKQSTGKFKGIAPGVDLLDYIAFNGSGKGFLSDVLASLDFAAKSNVKMICMAFSSLPSVKISKIFENYLDILANTRDIVLCAGTGNFGPERGTIGMPGCFDSVLTTGSTTRSFKVAPFSGRGYDGLKKPDFCLPGEKITSLNVIDSFFKDSSLDENEYYARFSGNSISVAILTGIVAMILDAQPALKPEDVKKLLLASCNKIRKTAEISAGRGLLSPVKAFVKLKQFYGFSKDYNKVLMETLVTTASLTFFVIALSLMFASFI